MTALIDGQLLTHGRLAAATTLPPAALDAALLDLELAGLVRRTTAGVQAIGLLGPPAAGGGPAPTPEPRGPSSPVQPPSGQPPSARVLEYSGSGRDDDRDD
jgi:hypothetical protein